MRGREELTLVARERFLSAEQVECERLVVVKAVRGNLQPGTGSGEKAGFRFFCMPEPEFRRDSVFVWRGMRLDVARMDVWSGHVEFALVIGRAP